MVRWAPFLIPVRRRLQTLAVLFWFALSPLTALPIYFGAFFFCLFICPILLPFFVIYSLWVWFWDDTPSKGGRPWGWWRKMLLWRLFSEYFPIKLKRTAELDPTENYLFCYHPHGIIGIGALGNFAFVTKFSALFPGLDLRIGTLNMNFYVPVYRELLLASGMVSVSFKSCVYNLTRKAGASMMIVVGGAKESLEARPGKSVLTLKNRKGFVRVALTAGANLVPVFSFGENDLWDQVDNPPGSKLRKWQDKFQEKVGFAVPLIQGRGIFNYDFGILPHRRKVTSVVGSPLKLPKIEKPTNDDINEWHAKYVEALTELYDTYREKYYPQGDTKLHIQ
eukprot:TRINITY_DN3843_c0_g1_i1.p1 TRINITY_DN3843_c0_g1~~TRINITY_DN3843_c0_g1_i1.p1  ORF type:complete len:336 (-),score=23.65 TRINITY_DN3843_c0_g1_i1:705-1712(-)